MTQTTLQYTYETKLHQRILKLCHDFGLKLHNNHYGPKLYTEYQRLALIVLFLRSGKVLRDFVAELYESRWPSWLGLREIPSKSALHDWFCRYTAQYPRLLNETLIKAETPSLMAVDATGIDSWQRSRHYEQRIGEAPMPYAKFDIFVDTERFIIHDHVLRLKPRHDVIGATSMFRRTKLRDVLVLGDKGYDSEPLHEEAANKQLQMYAPVRDFKVKNPDGTHRRRCAKGCKSYSRRNCVESLIHSFKNKRLKALRSKKHYMKKREIAWQVLVYNLIQLSKATALLRIMLNA